MNYGKRMSMDLRINRFSNLFAEVNVILSINLIIDYKTIGLYLELAVFDLNS